MEENVKSIEEAYARVGKLLEDLEKRRQMLQSSLAKVEMDLILNQGYYKGLEKSLELLQTKPPETSPGG